MEEELNEHDLEESIYAMLHHVDETEGNVTSKENQSDGLHILENAPKSTVRRYWRTNEHITPYQKVNTPKEPTQTPVNNNKQTDLNQTNQTAKPKEEKCDLPKSAPVIDLSILQSPVPHNIKRTIEIIEDDEDQQVVLESSDEDEVIEVALPPKPTITIESSDEDELTIINPNSPSKGRTNVEDKIVASGEREVSASPAPSAVSSVSDEFIRGDCIALNISSRRPDNPSFDFSLHGSDLLVQSTPSKKKKKKKNKEAVTSTPVATVTPDKTTPNDECFATPKSKAKNKKQKTKLYAVTEKSIPNADVYDSDSNQSIDTNKNRGSYEVTERSLPSTDVYESDSNLSECAKETSKQIHDNSVENSGSNVSQDKTNQTNKSSKKNDTIATNETLETISIVDLTDNDRFITIDNLNNSDITENILMGNVSGFTDSEYYDDQNLSENEIAKFGSTKIPAILNEDLDFDNLKGKDKVCKRRRYSLTTLRAEMEKFYNESWGGENFNHRELQKSMSRDKSLWVIDPKDRMPSSLAKRKICNYCNRPGHRDDACRMKPPVCYMCGLTGHLEPRCPRKICVNCGSPNQMYSSMCRNCCNWGAVTCSECGQNGHPATHCPDLWRRYHNTIDNNVPLERCSQTKKHYQLYCSGCTRRGHLVHTCRISLPFSGLPINSPYVYIYRPLHPPTPNAPNNNQQKSQNIDLSQESCSSAIALPRNESSKRQSKSPNTHETHINKKRNTATMSACEETEQQTTKSPVNTPQTKSSVIKEDESKKDTNKTLNESIKSQSNTEKALNIIPVCSANHDKKGNIIQDSEISDTSDVITSARIYITNDVIDKLKTEDGKNWLRVITEKYTVDVQTADVNSFLNIRGKLVDQEAFQAQLRDWAKPAVTNDVVAKPSTEGDVQNVNSEQYMHIIPKNRYNLLRQLSKALESLKEDLGDPSSLYKELMYLENRHQQLLKQKIVNPKQVTANRGHINHMLKRLNMVLLGQAGLADGSVHVSELYSFQEKLMNSRQKNIPTEIRKEIGQHYITVFTATPRDDYMDLLKMYRISKQSPLLTKKNKKALKYKPNVNRLQTKVNSIPTQPIQIIEKNIVGEEKVASNYNPHMMQKLAFYHKRLLSARPNGPVLKKTRLDLVRKLHSFIASMFKKEKISSKAIKKMKKTQEQAQLFLSNV